MAFWEGRCLPRPVGRDGRHVCHSGLDPHSQAGTPVQDGIRNLPLTVHQRSVLSASVEVTTLTRPSPLAGEGNPALSSIQQSLVHTPRFSSDVRALYTDNFELRR